MSARVALVLLLCLSLIVPSSAHAMIGSVGGPSDVPATLEAAVAGSAAPDAAKPVRDCHGKVARSEADPVADVHQEPSDTLALACCDDGHCQCVAAAFLVVAAHDPPAPLAAEAPAFVMMLLRPLVPGQLLRPPIG